MFHAMNYKETSTMYACKSAIADELSNLFGDDWDITQRVLIRMNIIDAMLCPPLYALSISKNALS